MAIVIDTIKGVSPATAVIIPTDTSVAVEISNAPTPIDAYVFVVQIGSTAQNFTIAQSAAQALLFEATITLTDITGTATTTGIEKYNTAKPITITASLDTLHVFVFYMYLEQSNGRGAASVAADFIMNDPGMTAAQLTDYAQTFSTLISTQGAQTFAAMTVATSGNNNGTESGRFGPEAVVAKRMDEEGATCYIIKRASGGSSVIKGGSTEDWNINSLNDLSDTGIALFANGMDQIITLEPGKRIFVLPVYIDVGEQDAKNSSRSLEYQEAVRRIMWETETRLGMASMPWFIAQTNSEIGTTDFPFITNIRTAQTNLVAERPDRTLIDRSSNEIVITGITNANPAVVTAASHNLSNGDNLVIQDVSGVTGINNKLYVAGNVTASTLELVGIDTTAFTSYSSGGTLNSNEAGFYSYQNDPSFDENLHLDAQGMINIGISYFSENALTLVEYDRTANSPIRNRPIGGSLRDLDDMYEGTGYSVNVVSGGSSLSNTNNYAVSPDKNQNYKRFQFSGNVLNSGTSNTSFAYSPWSIGAKNFASGTDNHRIYFWITANSGFSGDEVRIRFRNVTNGTNAAEITAVIDETDQLFSADFSGLGISKTYQVEVGMRTSAGDTNYLNHGNHCNDFNVWLIRIVQLT